VTRAHLEALRGALVPLLAEAQTPEELDAVIDVVLAALAPRTAPQLGLALERVGRYPRAHEAAPT
jgi:hypothetical protein